MPPDAPPPAPEEKNPEDWGPYSSRVGFELAHLLYSEVQMSAPKIDRLLELWAADLAPHRQSPSFHNHTKLYDAIDATPLGDVPWGQFTMTYDGDRPADPSTVPS